MQRYFLRVVVVTTLIAAIQHWCQTCTTNAFRTATTTTTMLTTSLPFMSQQLSSFGKVQLSTSSASISVTQCPRSCHRRHQNQLKLQQETIMRMLPDIQQHILIASETEAWVQPVSNILDPFLNFMSFAMLARVVISWYPELLVTSPTDASNNDSSSNSNKVTISTPPIPQENDVATTTAAATSSDNDVIPNDATVTNPDPNNESKPRLPMWISFIVLPTQPLLSAVKGFIPSAFGVDITPIFWLAIFTFIHEILLGQQGLLTMKIRYGI